MLAHQDLLNEGEFSLDWVVIEWLPEIWLIKNDLSFSKLDECNFAWVFGFQIFSYFFELIWSESVYSGYWLEQNNVSSIKMIIFT